MRDQQGMLLRESTFDDANGVAGVRDHRVTYASGTWSSTSPTTWSASRVAVAGLWQWDASSPWGGTHFYIGQHEAPTTASTSPSRPRSRVRTRPGRRGASSAP